ncbi:MAG TPA: plastocyanin/azurin family copper-binding protein [Actinomycetota bacterium]|jgi:plastocyanin
MFKAAHRFRALLLVGLTTAVVGPVFLGGTASAGGGCHDPMTVSGSGVKVDAKGICFFPTVLYVKQGAKVTWTNRDAAEHSVTGLAGEWGTGYDTIGQGESVTADFATEGVYPYTCIVHPGMVGAVVVGSPSAPSKSQGGFGVPSSAPGTTAPQANPVRPKDAPASNKLPASGVAWPWLVVIGVVVVGVAVLTLQRLKARRLSPTA